jgi:hypothetical protein
MKTLRAIVAGAVLSLAAMSANATAILGTWDGAWSGSGIQADFDLVITSQNGSGAFSGYFDWLCTSGLTCSGREFIAGTQSGTSLSFATTGFGAGYVNLGPSSYTGSLLTATTMSGTDAAGGAWRATQVPEPGALALLGIGLAGLGFGVRRKA